MLRTSHQRVEVRCSVGVASDEFGVDNCGLYRQRRVRESDEIEPPGRIVAIACEDDDVIAGFVKLGPPAVVFDFVNPLGADWWSLGQDGDGRKNERGFTEHASFVRRHRAVVQTPWPMAHLWRFVSETRPQLREWKGSVVLPCHFALPLYFFWLLVVDTRHGIAGHTVRVQQFIQLGLN